MSALPTIPTTGDNSDAYRPAVSDLFASRLHERQREEKSHEAETNLLASIHLLREPFAGRWERAGNRLREERLMGLYPPRKTVSASTLSHFPGHVMDEARHGHHVTILNHGQPVAVMLDAAEYARLKVDKRLLEFEGKEGDVPPSGWPE